MENAKKIERALISVYDKTELATLVIFLKSHGIEIISSGGTARHLAEHGISVTDIATMGQVKEILDGRIKTLDWRIHGGILGDRSNPSHNDTIERLGLLPIDLVVVNFYPFASIATQKDRSIDELIENIDIGGPAMLRSAAKNHAHVVVLHHEGQYRHFIDHYQENHGTSLGFRQKCAQQAFGYSYAYDQTIAQVLCEEFSGQSESTFINLSNKKALRYGENPHQTAKIHLFDAVSDKVCIPAYHMSSQRELSYNNILDAHSAIWALRCLGDQQQLGGHASAIIKHGIPCGAAIASTQEEAIKKAIASDEQSAFGGILATSSLFTENCAIAVDDRFLELIVAPGFSDQAIAMLSKKRNLLLLPIANLMTGALDEVSYRSIFGGILSQSRDHTEENPSEWSIVSEVKPTSYELLAMEFANRIVKAIPSNAIAIASIDHLYGVGAGQPSRIQSAELAFVGAKTRHFDLSKAAMASDGFFPFGDCLELAHRHGCRLVIQPGGSIRDQEIIDVANRLGMAMVFTHKRHFKH